jgi:hypothetical protein
VGVRAFGDSFLMRRGGAAETSVVTEGVDTASDMAAGVVVVTEEWSDLGRFGRGELGRDGAWWCVVGDLGGEVI